MVGVLVVYKDAERKRGAGVGVAGDFVVRSLSGVGQNAGTVIRVVAVVAGYIGATAARPPHVHADVPGAGLHLANANIRPVNVRGMRRLLRINEQCGCKCQRNKNYP